MAPKVPASSPDDAQAQMEEAMRLAEAAPKGPKMVDLEVNLGESTDHISVNGIKYYHGHRYRVTEDQARSMNEIAHNTRMHDEVVKGNRTVVGHRYKGNKR